MSSSGRAPAGIADLTPFTRRREQRAWYWYDWANSGYVTDVDKHVKCTQPLHVLGLDVSPGSLIFYVITIATIISALVLPVVGAAADRSSSKRRLMAGSAWLGSIAAAGLYFVHGTNWQLGARIETFRDLG